MEIERKFLIDKIPESIDLSGLKCRRIEQGYLCTEPVVRVRRDNDDCYLTYTPPEWFGKDVTNDAAYHNSNMAGRA